MKRESLNGRRQFSGVQSQPQEQALQVTVGHSNDKVVIQYNQKTMECHFTVEQCKSHIKNLQHGIEMLKAHQQRQKGAQP